MDLNGGIGDTIKLRHASGSTATISRLGATVLSFQTPRTGEILWVDPNWSGSSNHGGIPIIFPVFGKAQDTRLAGSGNQTEIHRHTNTLPHHGFARLCLWDVITPDCDEHDRDWPDYGPFASECDVTSRVILKLVPQSVPTNLGRSWLDKSGEWELSYRVSLGADALTLDLRVNNCNVKGSVRPGVGILVQDDGSPQGLIAKILFHNYFRVPDPGSLVVRGLEDAIYRPKPGKSGSSLSGGSLSLSVPGHIDQVWTRRKADEENSQEEIILSTSSRNVDFQIMLTTSALPDIVLWAPREETSRAQSGSLNGRFICIEPGMVVNPIEVPPAGRKTVRQIISVLHSKDGRCEG